MRFEKHPKAVSGALRDRFRAGEVFGSFEKRTLGLEPGPPDPESRVFTIWPPRLPNSEHSGNINPEISWKETFSVANENYPFITCMFVAYYVEYLANSAVK